MAPGHAAKIGEKKTAEGLAEELQLKDSSPASVFFSPIFATRPDAELQAWRMGGGMVVSIFEHFPEICFFRAKR